MISCRINHLSLPALLAGCIHCGLVERIDFLRIGTSVHMTGTPPHKGPEDIMHALKRLARSCMFPVQHDFEAG